MSATLTAPSRERRTRALLSAWAGLDFDLPPDREAGEPPEARGLARDEVRLMVSYRDRPTLVHSRFRHLDHFLSASDLLVINTSGTLNAALPLLHTGGETLELHLSTRLPDDRWIVELRRWSDAATEPFRTAQSGEIYRLPEGGSVRLNAPYLPDGGDSQQGNVRLWVATLMLPLPLHVYLTQYGAPIRYRYVRDAWPLSYYQTVYATEPGSAEMPSAGRAFTPELITRLVSRGVQIAPLLLHAGVASLEDHEPPYEEYYRVPETTARLVNATKATGKRVIAVGTTVVRALETVTGEEGITRAGEGWTRLIVTPERGVRAANGLLTGLHEPRATHLAMLQAFLPRPLLESAYREALRARYLWHEFGDLHLILPD